MKNNIRRQHRTMRGQVIDMEALRTKHELMPAIGNANMNARGDILGPTGNIVVKREQIVQAYYANNPQGVKQTSLKDAMAAETYETPQQAIERLTAQINKKSAPAQPAPLDEPSNVIPPKLRPRKLSDKPD